MSYLLSCAPFVLQMTELRSKKFKHATKVTPQANVLVQSAMPSRGHTGDKGVTWSEEMHQSELHPFDNTL